MQFCSKCGTRLDDTKIFCTTCGTKLNEPYSQSQNNYGAYDPNFNYSIYQNQAVPNPYAASNGKATTSMILGILSFFVSGVVLGILAIVFAMQAKKLNGGTLPPRAKAGLICGIIGLVFAIISIIIVEYIFSNLGYNLFSSI